MKNVTSILTALWILCASTALAQGVILPLPAEDSQRINSMLGPGVVGNPVPSKPLRDGPAYFPLQNKTLTFQVTSGKNVGNSQSLSVSRRSRPDGQPAWRFQFSPTLSGFLKQTVDGALIMPAVSDSGEGVVVVSTPANPFLPQGMNPGETRSFSQNVSVNYLDNPSDQRYAGTVAGTYTYLGTYQVTVPAGTFNADLIRVKFEGQVGPAHTKDTQYNFFAPGVGVVAMITQEDIEAFWIFNIDTSTGKVLGSQ
ncbi:MAG: hypothetical protein JO121_08895 [Deltaproteobacteria bacterium]|nr:hypothetical protein [Deltaproteobacteria bacterium]